MALYSDGPAVNADELVRYETSLLDVLRVEQVPVDIKIDLAQELCGQELAAFIRRNSVYASAADDVLLQKVVLDARLRRWIAMESLKLIFGDAYSRQLNDRYTKKKADYTELARDARDHCFSNGVGLVNEGVARAPRPMLHSQAGQGASGTYYVAISEVRAGIGEGSLSDTAAITVADGSRVLVESTGPAMWNVYAGTSPDEMLRQNEEPITAPVWALLALDAQGPKPTAGQRADVVVIWQRRLRRG